MFFYDAEQCSQMKSGEIVGFVNQPWFSWSFTFQPKVSITEIGQDWNQFNAYDNADNKNVVVEITYTGANPESADAIVSQLKPI